MSGTASALASAWAARAKAAEDDLRYVAQAPALFKPEWVEQRMQEHAVAVAWVRYWTNQEVSG